MAMIWVTDEGVQTLDELSKEIMEDLKMIEEAADKLESSVANVDDLGPHADSIQEIISDIRAKSEEAEDPVNTVSGDLKKLSEKYADFISHNPFANSGN